MNTPYTYSKALDICLEYQYLVDCALSSEYRDLGRIEHVAISPASEKEKNEFIEYFKAFNDVEKALSFFDTKEYDVVLISRNKQLQVSVRDLSAHIAYQKENKNQIILD